MSDSHDDGSVAEAVGTGFLAHCGDGVIVVPAVLGGTVATDDDDDVNWYCCCFPSCCFYLHGI